MSIFTTDARNGPARAVSEPTPKTNKNVEMISLAYRITTHAICRLTMTYSSSLHFTHLMPSYSQTSDQVISTLLWRSHRRPGLWRSRPQYRSESGAMTWLPNINPNLLAEVAWIATD